MQSKYQILDDSQSDSDDCVIIEFEDEEDIRNSLNFRNADIKVEPSADFDEENDQVLEEEMEDEEDVLVVGCDSDDDIDGILNKPEEVSNPNLNNENFEKKQACHLDSLPQEEINVQITSSDDNSTMKHSKKRKEWPRKRKKRSKRISPSLEQELELSESDEKEDCKSRKNDQKKKDKKRISDKMIKDFQLENDDTTDGNHSEKNNNDWKDDKDFEDDTNRKLEYAIYNLGNYCPSMLRGVRCIWKECPWIHYMPPEDAVSQFYRIYANMPQFAALQFYRYFTNLEIQDQLLLDAQEKLTEPIGVCSREVCREVLKAVVRLCGGMDLSLKKYMEMVDISTGVCDVDTSKDTMVSIFTQTLAMINDSGGREAHQSSKRLVKWSWTHLYLSSVSKGVILPDQFYTDLTELLSSHNMISQLAEVLLYTSLLPSLKPPLRGVADVLICPPSSLTSPHSTAVFTGQVLSRLSSRDWISLHQMADIKPGLITLVDCLCQDDPADVHKFYESLPEMDGLDVPEVTPPPLSDKNIWLREQLVQGQWVGIAESFCALESKDIETLADFTEKLLLEISQLCGEFKLKDPIDVVYRTGTEVVVNNKSDIHNQFWSQLGVSLLVCEVTSSQWQSANVIIRTMSSDLEVNWTGIKPPGICQFADIDRGMVPLFVLETLVRTKQCLDIVNYLKLWDCLSYLESDLSHGKRDIILLSVLECLAVTNVNMDILDIIIRINEVMTVNMKQETDVVVRRRHEVMSNVTFMLMLNENLSGSRLYKRYTEVRGCSHELEKAVIRGLVTLLAHPRNNMVQEAMSVYISGVRWGVYSSQHVRRPLTIKLSSILTMEELAIIVKDFFLKLKKLKDSNDSLNVYVKMEEISVPNCGVRLLNSIGWTTQDAMFRFEKILCSPMTLRKAAVPYIEDTHVRNYLNEL